MTGTVLQGPFRGRDLGELSEAERAELLRTLRVDDPESASLLEAYLDRISPEWRGGPGASDGGKETGAGAAGGPQHRDDAQRSPGPRSERRPVGEECVRTGKYRGSAEP